VPVLRLQHQLQEQTQVACSELYFSISFST